MRLSAALALLAALRCLAGCATVTQEEPPSQLGGSDGMGAVPSGAGGRAGSAPIAETAAPEQSATGDVPSPLETNPGGLMPVPPAVASGGSGGAPSASADAGPQAPPGTLLLQENFENFQAAASGWATSSGSVWEVQTDSQVVSNVYTQSEATSSTPDLATAGDVAWRDVVVEADMKILAFNGSSSSYMAGLCVRVSDAQNFYLIGVRSNDGKLGLRRYADGGTNLVQSDFDKGTTGVWYHLKVEAIGSTLSAYLDGTMMFSETDDTHKSGGIALCTVRASASFDNIRVSAP
jgi:hypothetical protein